MRDCAGDLESHLFVEVDRWNVIDSNLQVTFIGRMLGKRRQRLFHKRVTHAQISEIGHDCHRDDVSFSSEPKFFQVGETVFETAHYIACDLPLILGHNESLWQRVERIDEEVGCVILREADSVNVNNRLNVRRAEATQCVVLLN